MKRDLKSANHLYNCPKSVKKCQCYC